MSATTTNVIANLVKTCIGTGMLALPNTVYLGGYIPAVIILIIVPIWITYCTKLVTDCFSAFDTKPKAEEDPYMLLADKAFGKAGVIILQLCFVITVYGIGVAYEITWNSLLSGLFVGSKYTILQQYWPWALIYCAMAIPLSLLKNLKVLATPSMLGNIFIVAVSVIVIVYGLCKFGIHVDHAHLLWETPLDLAKLFGVICYSLGLVVIAPTSYNTMKKPDQYNFALYTSVILIIIVYMSLGLFGGMSFSQDPQGINPLVIMNIDAKSWIYILCCIFVCFVAYFSYPIAVFPGILALESGIKESEPEEGVFVKNVKRVVLRIFMTCLVTFISIVCPFFKIVVSLIGCLTISFVTFIFPPLIHYMLVPQSRAKQIKDIVLACLGVCVMIVATEADLIPSRVCTKQLINYSYCTK